jgi:hypothetical protein
MDASWVASAPRYPAEKLLVANLPGVEVGSVLEYEFVSTVDGKPFFSTMQSFNGFEPVDSKTVTLTAPESMELNIRNTGIDETRSASDGTLSYVWKAENQPAVEIEEALPAWYTFNPTVFISSSDWKTYSDSVLEALMAATADQTEAQALAAKLIEGKNDDAEKAVAIRNWVAENIRQAGPALTSLPLSALSSADVTLADRYGNNPDRMILIYTLLKAAGFTPEFVLSGGISLIPEEADPMLAVPSRQAFNAVLVKINIGKEAVYMNGSSQYAELGTTPYDRRAVLDLNSGSIQKIEVDSDKEDRSHIVYSMNISADGNASLNQSSTVQGTTYEGFHQNYAEITPENRRRHYLEIVSAVSQSAKADSELLTAYDSYPGKLEFSVNAERYAVQDGDYLYFTIPGGLGGLLKYRSNDRELPLAWGGYVDSISEYHITLPEGYEPLILPESFSWQAPNGAGMVEIAVQYEEKSHTLRIMQIADLHPAIIPAEKFPEIIAASKKLAHPDMRTILLKKK